MKAVVRHCRGVHAYLESSAQSLKLVCHFNRYLLLMFGKFPSRLLTVYYFNNQSGSACHRMLGDRNIDMKYYTIMVIIYECFGQVYQQPRK